MSTEKPSVSRGRGRGPGRLPAARVIAEMDKEQIAALRQQELLRGLSDVEVLRRWFVAEDQWELTERQDWVRQRWEFAKAMFMKRRKFLEIQQAMVREFGISAAQAYRDFRNALNCFGDIDRIPAEAHRQRSIEMALEAYRIAKKAKDADGMTKAVRMYYTAAGLDKDDPDRIDLEKLMSERVYAEVLDPAIRDLLLNFMEQSGGSIDVSRLFELLYSAKDGEYISYEQASDDAATGAAGD